jgi:hypothetical protein
MDVPWPKRLSWTYLTILAAFSSRPQTFFRSDRFAVATV